MHAESFSFREFIFSQHKDCELGRDCLMAGMNMRAKAEGSPWSLKNLPILVLLWQIVNLSFKNIVTMIVVSASGDVSLQPKD